MRSQTNFLAQMSVFPKELSILVLTKILELAILKAIYWSLGEGSEVEKSRMTHITNTNKADGFRTPK